MTKLLMILLRYNDNFRREPPRPRHPSISVMTDQVETQTRDVQGEAITKYCWSEGKNTVSIYLELDGLDWRD